MAKLYGEFLTLSRLSESKPKVRLTQQTWLDTPFIIRGKYEGIPVWYYILVPFNKIPFIKREQINTKLICIELSPIVQYRDDHGQICSMFGWGIDPPKSLQMWFEQNYDGGTIDENINIHYENDDIRLCRIKRLRFDECIGINLCYHKQDHFNYIRLSNNSQSNLAFRAGMRNFDRFIELNGINIEQETPEQIAQRFKRNVQTSIEMLVCSPATYQHYKSNNLVIHSNLPAVKYLQTVFDHQLSNTIISTLVNFNIDEQFYVLQMENNNIVDTIKKSFSFKSLESIDENNIYLVENHGQYRTAKILCKGSKYQCEHFHRHCVDQLYDKTIFRLNDSKISNFNRSNFEINQKNTSANEENISVKITRFEHLPNEILFDILNYLTVDNIHYSLTNLNHRLTNLIQSSKNLILIFDDNTDQLLIESYKFLIVHLIIKTERQCDFSQFLNLKYLTIHNRNRNHIKQIQFKTIPNLIHLSFLLKSDYKVPVELVNDVFSNRFPFIRYVNLGHIDKPLSTSWSITCSIEILFIRCDHFMIIKDILKSCPNLKHFKIHLLNHSYPIQHWSSSFKHRLKRFTLWTDDLELNFEQIDALLTYIPNVTHLYLQTVLQLPFIDIIKIIIYRLKCLYQFDCFVKEILSENQRFYKPVDIHKIYLPFHRIECTLENEEFRIFSTE